MARPLVTQCSRRFELQGGSKHGLGQRFCFEFGLRAAGMKINGSADGLVRESDLAKAGFLTKQKRADLAVRAPAISRQPAVEVLLHKLVVVEMWVCAPDAFDFIELAG